jgi:DNA-binding XRE family transcriptional regulator
MTRPEEIEYTPPSREEIDICLNCPLKECDETSVLCRLTRMAANGEIPTPQAMVMTKQRKRVDLTDYGRNLIRVRREEMGLTKTELGRLIGVTHQVIGNVEKGRSKSLGANVTKIADVLGVSIDELFKED